MTVMSLRAIPVARRTSALYCATYGRGTPVLLIHGFGATGALFQPIVPDLAAKYQVLLPDLRGHGNSRRLPVADSIDRLADDLQDLLDLLGSVPAIVVGHAAGAAIAMQLAHAVPQQVRGLILIGAQADQPRRPALGRVRSLFGRSGEAGAHAVDAGAQLLTGFDCRPWLGTLQQPTLVIAGINDTLVPQVRARELVLQIRSAKLASPPAVCDSLPQTQPQGLLDRMLPWLAQHAG
ncbi:MAG TPA: alpha/beta fold hydrolase [Roseiflexaceae bacterium]|nr:alpha/beta fold hydrolase [Roseiflexaceae bacterium]HMP40459.1 alpha/beta fold hydrolase [Roseiflexaceae bacterium]